MPRYIDANRLIEFCLNNKSRTVDANDIARFPCTADVVERKKGMWIHGRELSREMIGDMVTAIFYEGWECSECNFLVEEELKPLWNFCPNCGADMRGDGNDD